MFVGIAIKIKQVIFLQIVLLRFSLMSLLPFQIRTSVVYVHVCASRLLAMQKSLVPWYEAQWKVQKKQKIDNISNSFREYHVQDIVRDVKQWMCFVPYNPIPTEVRHEYYTARVNIPPYELPGI